MEKRLQYKPCALAPLHLYLQSLLHPGCLILRDEFLVPGHELLLTLPINREHTHIMWNDILITYRLNSIGKTYQNKHYNP